MTKFNQIKPKQVFSETSFYTVTKVNKDSVEFETESGQKVELGQPYVENLLYSAHQQDKEEKVTKTVATEIFKSNPGVAMTVSFQKQVKEADVVAEIEDMYQNSTPKEIPAKLKKAVKKALDGEERVIVGKHWSSQDDFGRFHFTDMQIAQDKSKAYDVRQRLVDPRTINYLIVKGVKYTVK